MKKSYENKDMASIWLIICMVLIILQVLFDFDSGNAFWTSLIISQIYSAKSN